ncbi:MAG TPA: pyridoxamine 5'-phosphate oxidase [Thermoanaerobaculia bacterium]|nr:pyridoxamine 5'-phosphate oxidase [Thermoanaerobaculia bacterium]
MNLFDVRRVYARAGLQEEDLAADPMEQFQSWLTLAAEADPNDYTSMTLATADREGRPSARIVLLKGYDPRGFVFFSNYESRKAGEMAENPSAALLFYWPSFERQVRIEGRVEKTSREESEAYYRTRPRGSRIGAWASRQSAVIGGRAALEEQVQAIEERFPDDDIPPPDYWGGYRLIPERIEFWQGRPDRLHDRLRYRRLPDGSWTVERLSP